MLVVCGYSSSQLQFKPLIFFSFFLVFFVHTGQEKEKEEEEENFPHLFFCSRFSLANFFFFCCPPLFVCWCLSLSLSVKKEDEKNVLKEEEEKSAFDS